MSGVGTVSHAPPIDTVAVPGGLHTLGVREPCDVVTVSKVSDAFVKKSPKRTNTVTGVSSSLTTLRSKMVFGKVFRETRRVMGLRPQMTPFSTPDTSTTTDVVKHKRSSTPVTK